MSGTCTNLEVIRKCPLYRGNAISSFEVQLVLSMTFTCLSHKVTLKIDTVPLLVA